MKKNKLLIGLDIGGSKILGLLHDPQTGKTYAAKKQPIIKESLSGLLNQLTVEINRLSQEASRLQAEIIGAGIGVPGPINGDKIINCVNIPVLRGKKLGQILTKSTKIKKIILDNDLNCFLRAYLKKHPKLNNQSLVVIALGTGIGGSIAVDGQNIIKSLGISSELGHIIVDQSGHDLEYYYHKITNHPNGHLFAAAQQGDETAKKKVEQFAHIFGLVMANLNTILNPKTIILTGGVARYHQLYLSKVQGIVKDYSFTTNHPGWRIGRDQKAAALGASLLVK